MKKLTLFFLLIISTNAFSDRVMYDWTKCGRFCSYTSNVTSDGKIQTFSLLDTDNDKDNPTQIKGVNSLVSEGEFDCINSLSTMLSDTGYSGHMGTGNVIMKQEWNNTVKVPLNDWGEKQQEDCKIHKWTLTKPFDYEDNHFYVDKSTIKKTDKTVMFLTMIDYDNVRLINTKQYYSMVIKIAVNCDSLTFDTLNTEAKSGHMGDGKFVYSEGQGPNYSQEMKKDGDLYKEYCT